MHSACGCYTFNFPQLPTSYNRYWHTYATFLLKNLVIAAHGRKSMSGLLMELCAREVPYGRKAELQLRGQCKCFCLFVLFKSSWVLALRGAGKPSENMGKFWKMRASKLNHNLCSVAIFFWWEVTSSPHILLPPLPVTAPVIREERVGALHSGSHPFVYSRACRRLDHYGPSQQLIMTKKNSSHLYSRN